MGLLQKLKSLFGSDQSSQSSRGGDPDVTVEREPSAESEHAVKGTGGADQVAEQGTEAGSGAETAAGESDTVAATEPGSAAEAEAESTADTGTEETEETGEAEDSGEAGDSPPLEEIKGIGPTYADRLGEAGYESVADLAGADAAAVAEAAQTGEGRASDWIERAQNF